MEKHNFRDLSPEECKEVYFKKVDLVKRLEKKANKKRLIAIVSLILLIASLFISVEKYNYEYIPIEYTQFSNNTIPTGYYYADSIVGYAEAFSIKQVVTANGTSASLHTDTYYLVVDSSGFQFLICENILDKGYFKSKMASEGENARFYGQPTTLPQDLKMDTSDYFFQAFKEAGGNADLFNFEDVQNSSQKDFNNFQAFFRRMPILEIQKDYSLSNKVTTGRTTWGIVILIVRLSLLAAFILLWILVVLQKAGIQDELNDLAALLLLLPTDANVQHAPPTPTEAPPGYDLWECRCGMKNSTQYSQCKKCGKMKGS